MAAKRLRALGGRTVHVVLDMQRVFAEATDWHVAALASVLPRILSLVQAHPHQCLFTRFMTPPTIADASGDWQRLYERWPSVVLDRMDSAMLDLIEPLARLAPPGEVVDKTTYSAFPSADFLAALSRRNARTLVLSGVETDVCVLATALDAVDRGLHVVVAADAVASSSLSGHRAALDVVQGRFDQQIEIATVGDVVAAWTGQ